LASLAIGQKSYILKKHEIKGGISPKSVVSSGTGLFAAQNMMYRHTVTIYNEKGDLLQKIPDAVNLEKFGFSQYTGEKYRGGPVEAAFTSDGKYLWVSNYSMVGEGFDHEGCDGCIGDNYDNSFLYKINTQTFEIENVVEVGAVPKFIKISADDQLLIVSNWTSSDISVVDLKTEQEIQRVKVGPHPRGVEITKDNKTAFVTIMGSSKIAVVDLQSYEVDYIKNIGAAPRHLLLSQSDSVLYVSLNSSNKIVKYQLYNDEKFVCKTPSGPRSMCLDETSHSLYCVNYFDHSFSKINTQSMELEATVATADKPIGICGNWRESEIWVACYSGKIEIFKDFKSDSLKGGQGLFGIDWSVFSWPSVQKKSTPESELDSLPEVEEIQKDTLIYSAIIPKQKNLNHPQPTSLRFTRLANESGDCTYFVICGSFSIAENAQKRVKELTDLGYSCEVIEGRKLTHVSPSCAETREKADEAMSAFVNQSGFSAWILKR